MGKSRYRINRTPTDAIAKCEHKKTNFPKWPTPIIENFQKHLKKKKKIKSNSQIIMFKKSENKDQG